jgi:hypothetical protein
MVSTKTDSSQPPEDAEPKPAPIVCLLEGSHSYIEKEKLSFDFEFSSETSAQILTWPEGLRAKLPSRARPRPEPVAEPGASPTQNATRRDAPSAPLCVASEERAPLVHPCRRRLFFCPPRFRRARGRERTDGVPSHSLSGVVTQVTVTASRVPSQFLSPAVCA